MNSCRISAVSALLLSLGFIGLRAAPAFSPDRDFHRVVETIEARYGVRHRPIPLLGFALLFARPEGVGGMKLAVFEDFPAIADCAGISRLVEASLGPGWYRFVRVRSRGDREATLIYANPFMPTHRPAKMRMMILNLEPRGATVVELSLSERSMQRWLKDPAENAETEPGHPGDR